MDILLCLLVSVLVLPIALLNVTGTVRLILGLPFLLFIPGYVLVFTLFPQKKTDRGISTVERFALSFGLSIAVTPLLGLMLNYTPWGIRLETILLTVFGFIVIVGILGVYRWYSTEQHERYVVSLTMKLPKHEHPIDRALTIILISAIVVALIALIYVLSTPKTGERFTEFYILGPTRIAAGYPRNLSINENATVWIGVTNYEQHPMKYTIEIWLVNQSTTVNTSTNTSTTQYHHAWYLDTIAVTLNSSIVDTEEPWTPQWEHNYTFTITRTGDYKLIFLLYTNQTLQTYQNDTDYAYTIEHHNQEAYRGLHLWLHITSPTENGF